MPCPICRGGPPRPRDEFPVRVCEQCGARAKGGWRHTETSHSLEKQSEEGISAVVDVANDGEILHGSGSILDR